MEHIKGIIGIELSLLEEVLRSIVRQEMAAIRDEIKQTLISTWRTSCEAGYHPPKAAIS